VPEIGGMGVVCMDAANPRRGEQRRVRPVLIEPVTDCGPIAQINRITVDRKNPAFLSRKPTGPAPSRPCRDGRRCICASGKRKLG
jgi:hypothetical protein